MRIFAISDPHLALGTPHKEMSVFGDAWRDHAARLATAWRERVGLEDLVLVPGDLSWAMRMEGARPDLEFLGALPGRKVLARGNHDYWWSTLGKVRAALPVGMLAVQGDAVHVGRVVIGGTRLWEVPGVEFGALIDWTPNPISRASQGRPGAAAGEPGATGDAERDLLIYRRELGRLDSALARMDALSAGIEQPLRIVILHYPPCDTTLAENELTQRFEAHGIRHVVFGHLHALRRGLDPKPFGERGGVHYHLTSCDWLDFAPVLIDEV